MCYMCINYRKNHSNFTAFLFRFDFINETSDHYTYYRSRIRQFQNDPVVISNKSVEENVSKSGVLVPSSKPVSFQIKKKDDKRTVMEYKSSILYKTAKADENDEDGLQKDITGIDVDSKVCIGVTIAAYVIITSTFSKLISFVSPYQSSTTPHVKCKVMFMSS